MPRKGKQTAVEWLQLIECTVSLQQYAAYCEWLHAHGSKERRSLWDILAGEVGVIWYDPEDGKPWCKLVRFGRVFWFPIYAEACSRRGVAIVRNAWLCGVQAEAHREPQVGKYGPRLRT